ALRLEAPPAQLVRRVVEARLCRALDELPDREGLPDIYPFSDEQVARVARTEPTLRDMLQQFRHLFDHVVYGPETESRLGEAPARGEFVPEDADDVPSFETAEPAVTNRVAEAEPVSRLPAPEVPTYTVKSVEIIESAPSPPRPPSPTRGEGGASGFQALDPILNPAAQSVPLLPSVGEGGRGVRGTPDSSPKLTSSVMLDLWSQEQRSARRKLEPEGALTGATRELQAGLGTFLQACHEHGVKVGPWRLQHVVPEFTFGEHPTYGAITIAHWACKDGQPWKVGIGLFLARSAG